MRWQDGDDEVKLLETATELHVSIVRSGIDTPAATYQRGQVRSILDIHSGGTCTLRVQGDDGVEKCFAARRLFARASFAHFASFKEPTRRHRSLKKTSSRATDRRPDHN